MTLVRPKQEHHVCYNDLVALLRKHEPKVSSLELLAIAANMVGKMVALQDQRTVTAAMAMEIVARNLEVGNQEALQQLQLTKGHA
jgi:Asp-tRNA(Asn)/Glu-tRNA(Gln) amidotransferase B subunit